MARLDCDLLPLLMACAGGDMGTLRPVLADHAALTVIVSAKGYPGTYTTGSAIGSLQAADAVEGVTVLHAGTKRDAAGTLVSNGGRVLAVTATAPDLRQAQANAYRAVDALEWQDGYCRRDIGWRALSRSGEAEVMPENHNAL